MSNNNNNNNDFSIGTHVSFDYDSLKASGIIASYSYTTQAIVILDNQDGDFGWIITSREIDDLDYINKYGWSVPISYLKHTKTKLGNVL